MRATKIVLLLLLISTNALGAGEAKYRKIMSRAGSYYAHFSYQKSIDWYQRALEIKDAQEPKIQLANCYRMLNRPEDALKWYQAALVHGKLSDEDMLHYGQVLSSMKKYDSAHTVLDKYQHQEEWVVGRAAGFKNVDKFFHNEMAYSIQEVIYNTSEADFAPSITKEGLVFVSGRLSEGMFKPKYNADRSYFLDLFVVDEGEQPVKFQRGINTRYHEGPSVFYDNDQKVIFTRNNYYEHKAGKSDEDVNHLKLYFSEKKPDGTWTKVTEFEYNNDQFSIGHPALTPDAQTLYFASDMPGGFGGVDLYVSYWQNGKWSTPQNLGSRVNTARDEMFPFVSKDEFLYFASDGHEGLGGLDIFRFDLTVENGTPRNLGFPLNTHKDDFAITFYEDGNKGYFSSNREGGTGNDDIYEVLMFDYVVKVNLRDKETSELISGHLDTRDLYMNQVIRNEDNVSKVQFPALYGDSFMVNGSAVNYIADSLLISTKDASRENRVLEFDLYLTKPSLKTVVIYRVEINGQWQQVMYDMDSSLNFYDGNYESLLAKFESERIKVERVVDLRNVLYDFDKHDIRPEAAADLDKWIVFLQDYPERKLSLAAHTDVRGSNAYNDRLAKRRVKAAKEYLLSKGIDKDRLVDTSFGKEKLFVDCGDNCDDVQHQNNRRTEVLVIK